MIVRQADAAPSRGQMFQERHHGSLLNGLFVAAVVTLLFGLYARVLPAWLKDLSTDPTYSHVYIVPVISGFVIWQRRRALAALEIRGSWRGLPLLVAGVSALILGDIGAGDFVTRMSLLVILAGLILFHFGPPMLSTLAFPLGFLLFMVPMPLLLFYAMTTRLQSLAAQLGAGVLDLLGVPILLDGNIIHLSNITLGVTEACSGIASLMTLVALAVAWAHLMLPRFWMQAVLTLLVLPITIVANASRVTMTGLIGRSFGVGYAEGFFHFLSGWLVFIGAVLCLLAAHAVLQGVASHRDHPERQMP